MEGKTWSCGNVIVCYDYHTNSRSQTDPVLISDGICLPNLKSTKYLCIHVTRVLDDLHVFVLNNDNIHTIKYVANICLIPTNFDSMSFVC